MKKLDQKGLTGPVEIGLIVLFAVFIGAVAYRIGTARNDGASANQNNQASDDEKSEIALNEEEKDEAKEVDVPAEEEKKKEVSEEPAAEPSKPVETEPVKKEEPKEEPVKKTEKVEFVSSSAEQSGDTISATATLESNQTGTCYLKLYRDDQPKIKHSIELNNQKVCETTFETSEIPVAGTWELHVWFASSDGSTEGWGDTKTIEVTL